MKPDEFSLKRPDETSRILVRVLPLLERLPSGSTSSRSVAFVFVVIVGNIPMQHIEPPLVTNLLNVWMDSNNPSYRRSERSQGHQDFNSHTILLVTRHLAFNVSGLR